MSKQDLLDYWQQEKIITDKRILAAFEKVKRENFVLEEFKREVYDDTPLPIGKDQTISQPTTVAIMTEALEPKEGQKILEVGSGSGYQAAILSEIVGSKGSIITTEIIGELERFSRNNLKNYENVSVINHDGSQGYEPEAPYDRIIITAACRRMPGFVFDQLKENGVVIVPIGGIDTQTMVKGIKKEKLETEELGYFRFVPLTGKNA